MKLAERSCAARSEATSARNGGLPSHGTSRNAWRSPGASVTAASNTWRARAHSSGFTGGPVAEVTRQPGLCECPSALDGRRRRAQCFRGLLDREPAKESHLDDARELRIEGREASQGIVEGLDVDRVAGGRDQSGIEGDAHLIAAALRGPARPRPLDQDLPHRPRGDAEKVRPALPGELRVLQEPEVHI